MEEGLLDRIKLQQQAESNLRIDGEQWFKSALGYYDNENLIDSYTATRTVRNTKDQEITLKGYEVFLYDTALALIEQKQEGPVVMLDLGGGAGGSWNRLAIALRDQIESSKLVLAVSNFTSDPEEQIRKFKDEAGGPSHNRTTECLADLEAARGLVHFLKGSFFDMRMKRINLPNGNEVKLEGNTDFIHERLSLTSHSITPELDIPIIGFLLSRSGIYSIPNESLAPQRGRQSSKVMNQRRHGIMTGQRTLEDRFQLQRIVRVETGPYEGRNLKYRFFRARSAPPITIKN